MKRVLSAILATTFALGLFSGCGSTTTPPLPPSNATGETASASNTTSGEKIRVYVHMAQLVQGDEKKDANGNTYRDPTTAYLKFAGDEFTKKTGIEVEFIPYSSSGSDLKPLLQVGDKSVDLFSYGFTMSVDELNKYTAPIMTKEEAGAIYGKELVAAMPAVGDDVHVLGLAKLYDTGVAYNAEVLKAAGYDEVPGTLAEFNTMLGKIKANGQTPIALHRIENWPLSTIGDFADYAYGQAGARGASLKFDEPFGDQAPLGKMLKLYTQWKSDGYFEQEVFTDFGAAMDSVPYGQTGMMLFGSWVAPQLISRVPEGKDPSIIQFDAAPDYGNGRFIRVAPAEQYAINKATEHLDACKQFLDFIAHDPEYLAQAGYIATASDVTPVVPDIFARVQKNIADGKVQQLYVGSMDENYINYENIMKEANLFADEKWAGLPFDAYDITKPGDWSGFNSQIDSENKAFKEAQTDENITFQP